MEGRRRDGAIPAAGTAALRDARTAATAGTTSGVGRRSENPEAVETVRGHRWTALAIESALTGIAGAHLALMLSSGFAENMVAGRGFIALSIVIFGRWNFKGAILGTALFGIAAAAQYALQAMNRGIEFTSCWRCRTW